MLYIVPFILHIQHLSPIHRDHLLPIHIPRDLKRPILHHICDIVNLYTCIRVTIHLPPLLHASLTPVLHLEGDPLVGPLTDLDRGGDHVLRLEAEGGGGAEPPVLHDVHIVHDSSQGAPLVALELESQVVGLRAIVKVVAVAVDQGTVEFT
jgi:hypothetical protein